MYKQIVSVTFKMLLFDHHNKLRWPKTKQMATVTFKMLLFESKFYQWSTAAAVTTQQGYYNRSVINKQIVAAIIHASSLSVTF